MSPLDRVPAGHLDTGYDLAALPADALLYVLLNVGDGDSQFLLLPQDAGGERQAVVVDVAVARKTESLVDSLTAAGLFDAGPGRGTKPFALVVATHPHADHIRGMASFLRRHRGRIDEFWHPGYIMSSATFITTMNELDPTGGHPVPVVSEPAAGTSRTVANTRLTALSPATGLRGRFGWQDVDPNDASVVVMVEYPASRLLLDRTATPPERRVLRDRRGRRLLLAGDAQHVSWSHMTVDFPTAGRTATTPAGYAAGDPLTADVLKIPHHGSKHGTNLELVERVKPLVTLVSSVDGGGSYNFPHDVALAQIREALDPIATNGAPRRADHDLKLHYTAGRDVTGAHLGSIGVVVRPGKRLQVLRFLDPPHQPVDVRQARLWS